MRQARGGGLLRSSLVVGAMTMLSRVLGLARDVVIAVVLGASANAEFFVAFKIPNFLRRLLPRALLPRPLWPPSEYRERDHAAVRDLLNRVVGALGGVLLCITILAVVAAPMVASIFAPGFRDDPLKFQLTTDRIRITFRI